MAKWVIPQFSKSRVDKAGKLLSEGDLSIIARAATLNIINNWRSTHSYVLHIAKKNLQKRAQNINPNSVSAQRLKRLSSITLKLRRNRAMKLTQMQDIAGCRSVMPTIEDTMKLIDVYEKSIAKNPPKKEKTPTRPEVVERYDYITSPKPDGYRSYHYVYKYWSSAEDKHVYNGLRVEIQIRSKLQHAWATAVEAVSTFTEQALKSGLGDVRWKRFFALVGSVIALEENCPIVPNTPTDKKELIAEIKNLFQELQVEIVLMGISATVELTRTETYSAAFLMVLDAHQQKLEVTGYRKEELIKASEEYLLVEEKYADDPKVQAVLVSVDSLATLQSAYPNYYLDTDEFLDLVRRAIA